ncbi:MAG: response regulator [Gammaproteobacteria bacterium]|nr:response regulator [Gammaproteobacteria bacterium]MDH5693704.1 response regulator [Gammaproteobacteria bacterium]
MSDNSLQKILYVEDEPDISQVAKLALENIGGFQVELCENGKVALEVAPAYLPDLILLDVMMPDMDGPTTLTELRKIPELKNVPVVFMTAKVQPSEVASYRALGAVDVISKPFDPMTLAEQVKTIWSKTA